MNKFSKVVKIRDLIKKNIYIIHAYSTNKLPGCRTRAYKLTYEYKYTNVYKIFTICLMGNISLPNKTT